MTRSRWFVVAAVLGVMVLGNVIFMLSDRGADLDPRAGDKPAVTVPPKTPPSDLPPAVPSSVPSSGPPAVSRSVPAGDGPPNYADNNAWKQRHQPTAAEQAAGAELVALIRPRLEALRVAGDLAPASTRQALLDLGLAADTLTVTPFRPSWWEATPTTPPGAVFAVKFSPLGCVVGAVRPERVQIEVTGAGAEFGCLEPFSH